MRDSIEGRFDFAFVTLAFAVSLWISISPRRALQVLLLRPTLPTIGETLIVRVITILSSPILALMLVWHVWCLIRAHLGLPE